MSIINAFHEIGGRWLFVFLPIWTMIALLFIVKKYGYIVSQKSRVLLFYTISLVSTFNFAWDKGSDLQIGNTEFPELLFLYILLVTPILTKLMLHVYRQHL